MGSFGFVTHFFTPHRVSHLWTAPDVVHKSWLKNEIIYSECQGTAEDNLSDIDQRIYEMYPHIANYEHDAGTNECETTDKEADFEVLADFDLPVASAIPSEDPQVTKTGGGSTVLSGNDSCEVSCM